MSYKWPNKDPDEDLDYSIDWSRFLGDETISTNPRIAWFINDADGVKTAATYNQDVTIDGLSSKGSLQTQTDTVATIRLSGGTVNKTYKLTCQMASSPSSLISERTVTLRIKEN
tara:strand:+ start:484 stop:825 length:342 start_codon:yes stop_codon:yes gene_type:complete